MPIRTVPVILNYTICFCGVVTWATCERDLAKRLAIHLKRLNAVRHFLSISYDFS